MADKILPNKRPASKGIFEVTREGRLLEGGVHQIFRLLGGAFIGGRRLKEGGRLQEDLRY